LKRYECIGRLLFFVVCAVEAVEEEEEAAEEDGDRDDVKTLVAECCTLFCRMSIKLVGANR
jgi:hypothetical protein